MYVDFEWKQSFLSFVFTLFMYWQSSRVEGWYPINWFFPGTPASSTTKTGCHDIDEILFKMALKCQKSNKNQIKSFLCLSLARTWIFQQHKTCLFYVFSEWGIQVIVCFVDISGEAMVAVIVWKSDWQLPMQSVLITTDIMSLNLDQCKVYNILW